MAVNVARSPAAIPGVARAVYCLGLDPDNEWWVYAVAKQLALNGCLAGLTTAQARGLVRDLCSAATERALERGWREFVESDWWRRLEEGAR